MSLEIAEEARLRAVNALSGHNNDFSKALRGCVISDRESARKAAQIAWRAAWDAHYDGYDPLASESGWAAAKLAWVATQYTEPKVDVKSTVIAVDCWLENDIYRHRLIRFLDHYTGWHQIVVIDNGSSPELCEQFSERHNVEVVNLQPHLDRTSIAHTDYAYAWRAVFHHREMLKRFDKVIHLQCDFLIMSRRLKNYVDDLSDGWTALWCPSQHYPETALQIVVKGSEAYENFAQGDPYRFMPDVQETILPLTRIAFEFTGDRYGERKPVPPYSREMDFWCQDPVPECPRLLA